MRLAPARGIFVAAAVLLAFAALATAQRGFGRRAPLSAGNRWAQYEYEMQDPVNDPPDADRHGEWAFGRLRYRSPLDTGRFYSRWGIDANKGDRSFITALARLTRVDAQPIETILDIDSDEMFNWPWLFAVSAGDWMLTADQATRLRKYFDRGGFLFVDDFHNQREWAAFMYGMHQMNPALIARDLTPDEPAFHILFNLDERIRVVGANVVGYPPNQQNERGGFPGAWRGIFDEKGRMIVAISFNQDVGDAWEFADDPGYPEKLTSEGIRLGVNYVVYSMTH
jgi:Domain of unknown function (DUF4159)